MNDPSAQIFAIALATTWCGFGLYGVLRKIERSPQARERLERFRRARLSTKAAFVAGLIAVVAIGGTKPGDGNGGGLRGGPSVPEGPPPDPAFGIVEVRTNNVALRAESASAVEVTDWRKHGSATGGVWLDFDEPFFRIGTNPVSRAYVAASGSISFDTTHRPPVGAPLPDGTGLPALAPLLALPSNGAGLSGAVESVDSPAPLFLSRGLNRITALRTTQGYALRVLQTSIGAGVASPPFRATAFSAVVSTSLSSPAPPATAAHSLSPR